MNKIIKSIILSLCAAVFITDLPFQAAAKPKNLLKSVKVGESVYFGRYEQDGNTDNGKEKIEWQVLSKKGGKALLISTHILDVKPYHKECEDITWKKSTVRKWLNEIFINAAFNEKEKKRIRKTEVVNKDNIKRDYNEEERRYTKGGNNTKDKVFLLSIDEVKTYFDSDKERTASLTNYAKEEVKRVDIEKDHFPSEEKFDAWFEEQKEKYGEGWWYWLRSPGDNVLISAAYVNDGGSVNEFGIYVSYDNVGIRPAIWVGS